MYSQNDKYKIHAISLEMQNEWLDIGDFCIPLALKWRTLIHDWSPALLKFYLNAFQMTLPDQSNLVRWGKGTEKTCYICGKAVGTARHLLVGCKVLLDSGQYSRRHDRVLEIIREAVSLSVARAQKGITTNERSVGFVREGTRAIKTNVKPYSILKAATDWTIMMDTCEKQYKIPEDICASASRPDIFMYSRILKRVVMIELTVPWETNIPKDHTIKVNKYYELTNELTRNRFVVDLYAVEVGARGITAKSLYNLLKDLGLSRTHINSFLERTSKAALVGSFQIWLGRERSLDSGAMHEAFQYELNRLRLLTAQTLLEAYRKSDNFVGTGNMEPIRLSAEVEGLGPVFVVTLIVHNTCSERAVSGLAVLFHVISTGYRVHTPYTKVPLIAPGNQLKFPIKVEEIFSENVNPDVFFRNVTGQAGEGSVIKVLLLKEGKVSPVLAATVTMPPTDPMMIPYDKLQTSNFGQNSSQN
nr:uncharacterized protein LOC116771451 [Danaus plexippus plexippus]